VHLVTSFLAAVEGGVVWDLVIASIGRGRIEENIEHLDKCRVVVMALDDELPPRHHNEPDAHVPLPPELRTA